MASLRRVGVGLVGASVSTALVLACVGAPGTAPVVDASTAPDTGTDAKDTGAPGPDGGADASVDAGLCSNPLVGNVLMTTGGGAFPIIPGSGPLVVGDYTLTGLQLDCNGACSANASIIGGLKVTSPGPGLITLERRIELQDALTDAGTVKLIDKWTGTFDQLNKTFQLAELCPVSVPDAGWTGGFPVIDGGSSGLLKIRCSDVRFAINNGTAGALLTFTKK